MTPGEPIPDSDHVAHQLSATRLRAEDGLPGPEAFVPRPSTSEWELSANWLEFFEDAQHAAARVDRIRAALLAKGRTLKKNHRLVVVNVGAAKLAVHNALKDDLAYAELRVKYAPEPRDQSHVDLLIPGVRHLEHPEQSERVSAAIRSVIHPCEVYEAVTSASAGV